MATNGVVPAIILAAVSINFLIQILAEFGKFRQKSGHYAFIFILCLHGLLSNLVVLQPSSGKFASLSSQQRF